MQPQGQVQVFLNLVAFGMSPQEALDAPRISVCFSSPLAPFFLLPRLIGGADWSQL